MRGLLILIVAVGGLAIDAVAFGGRYSDAAWQAAKYQGQQMNDEIRRWMSYVDTGSSR